eukprot:COSAG02_NODE_22881_length_737_cov_0.857367_1_plen_77_part_01
MKSNEIELILGRELRWVSEDVVAAGVAAAGVAAAGVAVEHVVVEEPVGVIEVDTEADVANMVEGEVGEDHRSPAIVS